MMSMDGTKAMLAPYTADTRARWEHYMETGEDLNHVYHARRRAA